MTLPDRMHPHRLTKPPPHLPPRVYHTPTWMALAYSKLSTTNARCIVDAMSAAASTAIRSLDHVTMSTERRDQVDRLLLKEVHTSQCMCHH